jgi:Ca2+-binding RTX toxin-like protein
MSRHSAGTQVGAVHRLAVLRLKRRGVPRSAIVLAAVVGLQVWGSAVLAATVNGTAGNDVLRGTPAADVIRAGAGDDEVEARGGNDQVFGGAGRDVLVLGRGADSALDTQGPDVAYGGPGPDLAEGLFFADLGRGNDRYRGVAGCREVRFGPGQDIAPYDLVSAWGPCVLRGGPGNDSLAWAGSDAPGDSFSTDIYGGPGADILKGGYNDDTLVGGAGPDALYADETVNPDRIFAGHGDDDVFFDGWPGGPPVHCGPGVDTVHNWLAPRRLVDCEVVIPAP